MKNSHRYTNSIAQLLNLAEKVNTNLDDGALIYSDYFGEHVTVNKSRRDRVDIALSKALATLVQVRMSLETALDPDIK